MASTVHLEIQSSATGPVIQGDHNIILLRDNLVTKESELNKTDAIETTLHAAVSNWNADLVKKFIVEHGIDVNVTNELNQTPLELLLSTVTPECDDKIVYSPSLKATISILLEHGASINADLLNEERTFLLLSSAVRNNKLDILESILKRGFDVHSRDRWNDRVLHEAADEGNFEAIKMLLTYGADKNIPGNLQEPPVFKLIRHIVSTNRKLDQEVIDMLDLLNCREYAKVTNYLGYTMLNFAVLWFHVTLIELLINTYGSDVNKLDYRSSTPLHNLIWALNETSNKEDVLKTTQKLLQCGASLTIKDNCDYTPLDLLKRRQEINQTNSFQYLVPYLTPLTTNNQNHSYEICSSLFKIIKNNGYMFVIVASVIFAFGYGLYVLNK